VYLDRPTLTAEVAEDAFRQKVLGAFFQHGRLIHLPAQRKKRQVVLERIVQTFEPDRDYPEPEVNEVLREYHEDVAALRRALIEHGLMTRAYGVYRRVVEVGAGTVNTRAP
jgi:ArsR family transcriptional regulator, arsenate/arsenite/antimonite-responsive transcriptional repressor